MSHPAEHALKDPIFSKKYQPLGDSKPLFLRGKYEQLFSTEDTFYKVSEKGKKTGFSGSLT